jgi:glyoxylase-like metal-dependent hydrolase (beta-lactamase superfamily II)
LGQLFQFIWSDNSLGDHFVGPPEFHLATIVSSDFQENAYVAHLRGRSECLIVDPGLEPLRILAHLDHHGLVPAAILNTHGHMDHIAGNQAIKKRWPQCPLVIGAGDAGKLISPRSNLSAIFGLPVTSPPADVTVEEGNVYSAAGFDLEVLAIPGHSTGHVVFLWKTHDPHIAFVGDVIFAGSIGRTDFPDGDFEALAEGIRTKLYTLPDSTILYSGHGPATTVGKEKRHNPFVRGD